MSCAAQSAVREWTIQLPVGASDVTYSFDCARYAYRVGDTMIVRGDAFTGAVHDSIHISNISIAYHKQRVYILRGRSDSLYLTYLEDTSTTVINTGLDLTPNREGSEGFHQTSGSLMATPLEPYLMCLVTYNLWYPHGQSYGKSALTTINTETSTKVNLGPPIVGLTSEINVSADGSSVSSHFNENVCEFSIPASSGGWKYYGDPNHTSRRNYLPTGFDGIVVSSSELYDLRYGVAHKADQTQPYLLSNLDNAGVMLGVKVDSTSKYIGAYTLGRKQWTVLDSINKSDKVNVSAAVFGTQKTCFVIDGARQLIRYALNVTPGADTATFERSSDRISVYTPVVCSIKLLGYKTGLRFRWFTDGRLTDSTDVPVLTVRPDKVGDYAMKAEICDSSGVVLTTVYAERALQVIRPANLQMIFRTEGDSINSLSLPPTSTRLAVSTRRAAFVHDFPIEGQHDFSAPIVRRWNTNTVIMFKDSEDSVYSLFSQQTNAFQFTHYVNYGGLFSSSSADVAKFVRSHVYDLQGDRDDETRGKIWFDAAQQSWMAHFRYFLQEYDDALFFLPTSTSDTARLIAGFSRSPSVVHLSIQNADAYYKHYATTTFGVLAYVMDLLSGTASDTIRQASLPMYSARLLSDSTLASNIAIYRKDSSWSVAHHYKFFDGIEVIRLPHDSVLAIIRANRDTVASIISVRTGATIQSFGGGYGTPTCALYDSVRHALHIGDDSGYVSTWNLSPDFTTEVLDDLSAGGSKGATPSDVNIIRIIPNPVDDEFSIEGVSPELLLSACVSVVDITGREFALANQRDGSYSAAGLSQGAYIVVVRLTDRIITSTIVVE